MDDKELQQEFINFVAAKSGAKTEAELNKYLKSLSKEQQTQLRNEFAKYMQEKKSKAAKKAEKGAKLNYIKRLNHKCADDEELYYFKKGGKVGCGCKKKEDGGVVKAQKGVDMPWVTAFKEKQAKKKAEAAKREKELEAQRKRDEAFADDENRGYNTSATAAGPGNFRKKIQKKACGSKMKRN